jgi:thioredoxin reductase (NADPH)/alkyl hydroperoxide reductase subunit F
MPHPDTDLVVIGAGPAGCSAALMASSLGLSVILLERQAEIGGSLWQIAALGNVLGGFRTGADLARSVTSDIARATGIAVRRSVEITSIEPEDDGVRVHCADSTTVTARHAVVATGAEPAQPRHATWIVDPPGHDLPTLREIDPSEVAGSDVLVLGADRPLGTFLRANPDLDVRLVVPHPPDDAYKTDEVSGDHRVRLVEVDALRMTGATSAEPGGLRASLTVTNIGVRPAGVAGASTGEDGYCPPDVQHPRIHIAGDLRSARFQRVQTAMGSGAEAALSAYYSLC